MSMTMEDFRPMSVSSFQMSRRFQTLKILHKANRETHNRMYREWILNYIDPDGFYKDKMTKNPF